MKNIVKDTYKSTIGKVLDSIPEKKSFSLKIDGEEYHITPYKVIEFFVLTSGTVEDMGNYVVKKLKKVPAYAQREISEEGLSFTELLHGHYRDSDDVQVETLIRDLEKRRSKILKAKKKGLGNHKSIVVSKETLAEMMAECYVRSEQGKKEVQALLEHIVSTGESTSDRIISWPEK